MHDVADFGVMNQHIMECKMAAVSRYSMTRPFRVFGTARSSCRRASRCDDTRSSKAAQTRRRDLLIVPLLACTIHAAPGQKMAAFTMHTRWPVYNGASVACVLLHTMIRV